MTSYRKVIVSIGLTVATGALALGGLGSATYLADPDSTIWRTPIVEAAQSFGAGAECISDGSSVIDYDRKANGSQGFKGSCAFSLATPA